MRNKIDILLRCRWSRAKQCHHYVPTENWRPTMQYNSITTYLPSFKGGQKNDKKIDKAKPTAAKVFLNHKKLRKTEKKEEGVSLPLGLKGFGGGGRKNFGVGGYLASF